VTLGIVALVAGAQAAAPCTLAFSASGDSRLVANNLDCRNVFPRIWFVPASPGQHGRYCFGTDVNERIAEGGMNDQGLFIGVNALVEDTGWERDPDLPDWEEWEGWYESGVPDGILAKCSTVDEALDVFERYNLLTLAHVKFLIADRAGDSAIVEWSRGELRVVRRGDARHQVSTNFVTSDFAADETPCDRYRIADRLLTEADDAVTVATLRGMLSAAHMEFQTPTVLSSICDLVTGDIHVYYFHDFEQVATFNLARELASGRHGFLLAELYPVKPAVAEMYERIAKRFAR
jgi:hypothetical protein